MKKNIRNDFAILAKKIGNQPLIYLDTAATSQKPQAVIDAMVDFYQNHNSNIYRSVYAFGEETTTLYEKARQTVAHFINAHPDEIVFTKGATQSINGVAAGWAASVLKGGDEILLTQMEHHANLIPWQHVAQQTGATIKYVPILSDGTLDMNAFHALLSKKTKLVACVHVSNGVGTHNDIGTIIKSAHAHNARVLIDAAQSAGHQPLDVQELGADFLVFSGHKMLGPTGIGVLYINRALHDEMQPFEFGGGMVYEVGLDHATWLKAPRKFEAGTPPIAQAIGLAAAVDYIKKNINFEQLRLHEAALCAQLIDGLQKHKKIRILGPLEQLREKGHLVSFTVQGMHAHDVAAYLSNFGICVRAGNHCAQPLANALGIEASVRASFYGYNSAHEVEQLIQALEKI